MFHSARESWPTMLQLAVAMRVAMAMLRVAMPQRVCYSRSCSDRCLEAPTQGRITLGLGLG